MVYTKISPFVRAIGFVGCIFLFPAFVSGDEFSAEPTFKNPSVCDAELWNFVYRPGRLEIQNECIRVTGVISNIRVASDGDYHINLRLDAQYRHLLNDVNMRKQNGDLVLEPVCQKEPARHKTPAIRACKGFLKFNIMVIPEIGARVAVTGSYVIDLYHGWAEIHPVTSIASVP